MPSQILIHDSHRPKKRIGGCWLLVVTGDNYGTHRSYPTRCPTSGSANLEAVECPIILQREHMVGDGKDVPLRSHEAPEMNRFSCGGRWHLIKQI